MSLPQLHWRPLAHVVCYRHTLPVFEKLEDPHGHPEHPGDPLLTDFHCPNTLGL